MCSCIQNEKEFNDAEKCGLVDIICNEETTNADGNQDEPVLVKLRSKTISNKEKTSLYRSVARERIIMKCRSKSSRQPKQKFSHTRKMQKNEAVNN